MPRHPFFFYPFRPFCPFLNSEISYPEISNHRVHLPTTQRLHLPQPRRFPLKLLALQVCLYLCHPEFPPSAKFMTRYTPPPQ